MNIFKALQKINKLSKKELKQAIFQAQVDIDYYKIVIKNYPPKRMKSIAIPHMKKLKDRKKQFEDALEKLEK